MNFLGIQLTPGHFIVATILVVLYDSIWTFAFSNNTSKWWFERLQGLLKGAIYLGLIAFVVLITYTPWPWNLVLVVSAVLAVVLIVAWIRKQPKKGSKK